MARTGLPGVHISWAVPWSRRPVIFKRGAPWTGAASKLSVPQLKAALALAKAATAAYGTRGKIRYKGVSMPAVAVKVATTVSKGARVHGGKTIADRASEAHATAAASIAALEALLATKTAAA
jgi:hypothetical protein